MGEYTYYDDPENSEGFERNVLYHFPFIGDRLVIGKFCAIARRARFIMSPGPLLGAECSGRTTI
jgi:virginiamycin A acetyltransferase